MTRTALAIVVTAIVVGVVVGVGAYFAGIKSAHPATTTVVSTVLKTVTRYLTRSVTVTTTSTTTKTLVSTVPRTVSKSIVVTKTTTVPTTVTRTLVSTVTATRSLVLTTTSTVTKTVSSVIVTTKTVARISALPLIQLQVSYAKGFRLWKLGNYIVVRDAANQTFILVPRGAPMPSKAVVGGVKNATHGVRVFVLRVPVTRVVYMSSTEVALLYRIAAELHNYTLLRSIVCVGLRAPWFIPVVKQMVENGSIAYCGSMWAPNYEKIVSLHPQLVVLYTGYPAAYRIFEKMESLHLVVAVDNEWLEHSYLARFEWIKFIAAFYGWKALEEAYKIFDRVVEIHNELVKELSHAPKVTFLWFFPSAKWGIWAPKRDAYPIKFLESIGGVYVLQKYVPPGGGSVRVSKEVIAKVACRADVWIIAGYPPYISSIDDIAKVLGDWIYRCPAVEHHMVFYYTPSYWQLGYAYTGQVLLDLASILHPFSPAVAGHVRTFFHHLWRSHEEMKLLYAHGFSVTYHGFYKVVRDYMNHTWLVVPFDLVSQVPKSVLKSVTGVIEMPIHRVVVGCCAGMRLYAMNFTDLIVGVTGTSMVWWPKPIEKLIDEGVIKKVGCVWYGLNLELLEKLHPDAYIAGGGATFRPKLVDKIIHELHIPVVVIKDSAEHTILGMVEEAKLIAALLDEEKLAQKLLQTNVVKIDEIHRAVETMLSRYHEKPPTIVFVYYYRGKIAVCGAKTPWANLFQLAGFRYVNASWSGWRTMSLEEFIAKYGNVDWIIWSFPKVSTLKQLLKIDPRLKYIKAVREGHVIVETSAALYIIKCFPYRAVEDLVSIAYPFMLPGHKPAYLKPIAAG